MAKRRQRSWGEPQRFESVFHSALRICFTHSPYSPFFSSSTLFDTSAIIATHSV